MITRRRLFSALVGAVSGTALAQKAILEHGQAVVCESEPVKCPNGHDSCKSINAAMVVGNEDRNYPNWAQLYDYHIMRCEVCHVLFTRE